MSAPVSEERDRVEEKMVEDMYHDVTSRYREMNISEMIRNN